ncbi:MAG: TlpA family protein disulfide reductase [Muribaculaceae bacterium]|nr:TlpA family protein disulfide reductase [Muribaculaceae bacterium]
MKGLKFMGVAIGIGLAMPAFADIIVKLPQNCDKKTLHYYYAPIKQYAEAKSRAERGIVNDSITITNSEAVIAFPDKNQSYFGSLGFDQEPLQFFLAPGDNVTVDITSIDPFSYSLSGSPIADSMNELLLLEMPVIEKSKAIMLNGNPSEADMQKIRDEYNQVEKDFIMANPAAPAAPVALLNLEGEDFISFFDTYGNSMTSSVIYPFVEKQYRIEKDNIEMEKKQQAMQTDNIDAPDFTLKDLDGKDVSLSDFRGKWVIIDFWGSWCPWCIKGFPELKEAYQKYAGELEIIGVDCNESQNEWREGVKKYELPWVNVYNPADSNLTAEYGVQGFPTKAIINPEGKVANITVGHDPAFFEILTRLMGK